MAETRPTATAAAKLLLQCTDRKRRAIQFPGLHRLSCIITGYIIWRFINWQIRAISPNPIPMVDSGLIMKVQKVRFARMYLGGIIVPILIGCLLTVIDFCY